MDQLNDDALVQEKDSSNKKKKKDDNGRERKLSATFQDLPAPQLHWEKMSATLGENVSFACASS